MLFYVYGSTLFSMFKMFFIYLGDSEGPCICCFMSTDLHCPQCPWMLYIYLGDSEGPYICCLCLWIYTVLNAVYLPSGQRRSIYMLCLWIYTVLDVVGCSISTLRTAKVHICCLCLRIYVVLNVQDVLYLPWGQ